MKRVTRRWFALEQLLLALAFFYMAGSFVYSGGVPVDFIYHPVASDEAPLSLSYEHDAPVAWALTSVLGFVGFLFLTAFLRSLRLLAREHRHKKMALDDDIDSPYL